MNVSDLLQIGHVFAWRAMSLDELTNAAHQLKQHHSLVGNQTYGECIQT